jgi:prepilin-type N-terminal cleavage/methylation domain-containing protein
MRQSSDLKAKPTEIHSVGSEPAMKTYESKLEPRAALRSGFTLIEILMVVIILGIASAVVVPNIGTHDDLNVAAAARVVVADLIFAQNRAILSQSMRYVNFDTTNQVYAITSSKPNVTAAYEQNPVSLQNYITTFGSANTASSMQRVTLQTPSVDGKTCISFDELGQPYSCDTSSGAAVQLVNTATIPVRCGNFTLTVKVEPYTGALSVQ